MNLGWTTLCLGGYRPETMVITSALTGGLLAVHLASRVFEEDAARTRIHPAGWLLLPFVVYGAINAAWVTPVPWLGWRDWFGWAEMVAVFWVVLNGVRTSAAKRALFATLVALGVTAVLLGCYQRFVHPDWLMLNRVQAEQFIGRASGSFGIPNSLAAFLLLLLPALGALALRRGAGAVARVFAGWLTLVFGFGLVLTISRGAWIGLALALVAWPLVAGRGGWWRRMGLAVVVLGAVLTVGGLLYAAIPKVQERFVALVRDAGETTRPVMWRAAWKLFQEHFRVRLDDAKFEPPVSGRFPHRLIELLSRYEAHLPLDADLAKIALREFEWVVRRQAQSLSENEQALMEKLAADYLQHLRQFSWSELNDQTKSTETKRMARPLSEFYNLFALESFVARQSE